MPKGKKSKRKGNLWIKDILPEKNIFWKIKERKINWETNKTQSRQGNKNEGSLSPLPLLCKKMLKGVLQIKIKNMVNCKAEMYECIDITSKGKIDTNTVTLVIVICKLLFTLI